TKKTVVVADRLLSELETPCGEIAVILREMLTKRHAEAGLVAGSGHLRAIGKAVGVAIGSACHAQRAGLVGHDLREARFRTAEKFSECSGDIVRRAGDQRLDGLLDRDRATSPHAELRRGLFRRIGGNRNLGIETDAPGL